MSPAGSMALAAGLAFGGSLLGVGCHFLIERQPNLETPIMFILAAALALAILAQLP